MFVRKPRSDMIDRAFDAHQDTIRALLLINIPIDIDKNEFTNHRLPKIDLKYNKFLFTRSKF